MVLIVLIYCNGSKNTAHQLHAVTSIWSSCVEFLVQRILMEIAANLGLTLFEGDDTGAYAHSPAPSETYLAIDEAYDDWYKLRTGKNINCRHVIPVFFCLKEHPESGKM